MNPRIAHVGTFPPTHCGIASFTKSLTDSLVGQGADVGVVRLVDSWQLRPNADIIHQHVAGRGSLATANIVNSYDFAILQHEFGIYAGPDGDDVLNILNLTRIPTLVVLHTVLTDPTMHQRYVMQEIIRNADVLVTLSHVSRTRLIRNYEVNPARVRVIPHGCADLRPRGESTVSSSRPTILTWGLISQGKGIEWGIEALARMKDINPRPRYVIAGETHPKVRASDGEKYRESLMRMASMNGLSDDVTFVDGYMEADSLKQHIAEADVVLLPYDSRTQVTSGVLVEALVSNTPIVATCFPHAMELLGDGSGALVDHGNAAAMAREMRRILTDSQVADEMRSKSRAKAGSFLWSRVARDYMRMGESLVNGRSILYASMGVEPTQVAAG